jgi:hypothetical protein
MILLTQSMLVKSEKTKFYLHLYTGIILKIGANKIREQQSFQM